jgi:transcription elongation factor Elf1
MTRVTCPTCGTSYKTSFLNLPAKPGTKAVVSCVCGENLAIEFRTEWKVLGVTLRKAAHVAPYKSV